MQVAPQCRHENFVQVATAEEDARLEDVTDWQLMCNAADTPCEHGENCPYNIAAGEFFDAQAGSFTWTALARAIRQVTLYGPTKTTPVPFLVGPSNSGKTTVVQPLLDVFGEKNVFKLPAVTDKRFALRNWLKRKRFVFWDEFNPIRYADHGVMPVEQFLQAFQGKTFEIQVPLVWVFVPCRRASLATRNKGKDNTTSWNECP